MTVQNIGSESWCRQAYLNYHCYGNTMGLSPQDMGEITNAWSNRLSSWQNSVSNDQVEYEFDDSDYASYKQDGKEAAKEAAGGDEKDLQESGKTIGLTAGLAVNLIDRSINVYELAKGARTCAPIMWVSAAMEAALAIAYWAMRPNKDGKEACDKLQGQMTSSQELLTSTQADMEGYQAELQDLGDLAMTYNEDTNEELEEQKTEYDMYLQTMMNIQAKIESGEPLTESEKELYKSVVGYLQEIGVNIQELSDTTTEEIQALYEEMGIYQDGFDEAAQSMGEIEGLTDFAESFDKDTQTQAYVLGSVLGLNAAVSGTVAGWLFADANPFTKVVSAVFACTAAAAAVSNGFASAEQFSWAGEIGTEIDMREATQDLNTDTMGVYEEQIDYYAGYMEGVEDLELEIPDDIEAPEAVSVPTGGGEGASSNSSVSANSGAGTFGAGLGANGVIGASAAGNSSGVNQAGTANTSNTTRSSGDYTQYTDIVKGKAVGSDIKADGQNRVLISTQYATAIKTGINLPADLKSGEGFSAEFIPSMIAYLVPGFSEEDIKNVMNGKTLTSSYDASLVRSLTGEDTGKNTTVDNSKKLTDNLRKIINFYQPIFTAASARGWSTGQ